MQRPAALPRDDNEINLTPMLDVVFIMLIFFIVTATFLREQGIDVNRPESNAQPATRDAATLIRVDADDLIWIEDRIIDPRALRPLLLRLDAEGSDQSFVVQVAKASHTNALVTVLDAARAAGIGDIAIAEPVP